MAGQGQAMRARHSLADLDERIDGLRHARARLPELVRNRYASRHRRSVVSHDGRLLLVTTEHLLGGQSPVAIDRTDLLRRLAIALDCPGVDGLIAGADIVEDLLMLEILEDRVVFGALRLGEGDDPAPMRPAGFDPAAIAATHLEGGALTCPSLSRRSDRAACADIVSQMAAHTLVTLVSPPTGTDDIGGAATTISGLGSRSTFTWLVVPDATAVAPAAVATTLPLLVDVADVSDPRVVDVTLAEPGVLGIVVGGSALWPDGDDVDAVLTDLARRVHPVRPAATP